MVDRKENCKFDLGVKRLTVLVTFEIVITQLLLFLHLAFSPFLPTSRDGATTSQANLTVFPCSPQLSVCERTVRAQLDLRHR